MFVASSATLAADSQQLWLLCAEEDDLILVVLHKGPCWILLCFLFQIQQFPTKTKLSNVYRPTQNLNNRQVFASPATSLPPSE